MLLVRSIVFEVLMLFTMTVMGILGFPYALISIDNTYRLMKAYIRIVLWYASVICGLRWEVRGEVPQNEVVVAAKHQSFLDILILFYVLPRPKFVMKKELRKAPFLGYYAQRIGSIPVDRGKKSRAMQDMVSRAEARPERGQTVIYPQGTRVAPGAQLPYKIGAGVLYERMGVPAVLVATNAGMFWGRKSIYRRPGTAVVEFLGRIEPGLKPAAAVAEMERAIEPASDALMREAGFTG